MTRLLALLLALAMFLAGCSGSVKNGSAEENPADSGVSSDGSSGGGSAVQDNPDDSDEAACLETGCSRAKREGPSLREKEKQIKRDFKDGIDPRGGGMMVMELVKKTCVGGLRRRPARSASASSSSRS